MATTTTTFSYNTPTTRGAASSPARDARSFAEIVHQTRVTLLGLAEGLLGDPDLAEDVVQDALLEAWAGLTPRSDLGKLARDLRRLVRARCQGELRGGDRVRIECAGVPLTLVDPREGDAGEEGADWPVSCAVGAWPGGECQEGEEAEGMQELPVWPVSRVYSPASAPAELPLEQELIALALQSLPLEQRSPIELHYLQGLSLSETARALGMKKRALMKHLGACVNALRCSVLALLTEGVPAPARLTS